MTHAKPVNFMESVNPAHDLLVHCASMNMHYPQALAELKYIGYFIPKDQYDAFVKVLDIQMSLDIGMRQDEVV